jgi:hypothetical protein
MTDKIIAEIDAEIARLKEVRALLSSTTTTADAKPVRKRRKNEQSISRKDRRCTAEALGEAKGYKVNRSIRADMNPEPERSPCRSGFCRRVTSGPNVA